MVLSIITAPGLRLQPAFLFAVNWGNFGHPVKSGEPPNFHFHFIFMRLGKYQLTAVFLAISRLHLTRIIHSIIQKTFCDLMEGEGLVDNIAALGFCPFF